VKKLNTAQRDQQLYTSRIAWYYYKAGWTQKEIAEKLGLNRSRVISVLNEARLSGRVSIHVHGTDARLSDLEHQLCEKWNLAEAFLVPEISPEHINENIGLAAAHYLERFLDHHHQLIGLGWGSTISWMMRNIPHSTRSQTSFITLCGGVTTYLSTRITEGAAGSLLSGFRYPFYIIPTPLVVNSKNIRELLLEEPEVQRVLKMALTADLSFIGIGALEPSNSFSQFGYRSKEDLELLRRLGAVGEIHGQYFDANGQSLPLEQHERLIATRLSDLRKMKQVIGVAGGERKLQALLGALRGCLLSTLITDEQTAHSLLQ
jgi:DNA-binding transcriptional regulator LsrR (DeoR family)